MLVLPTARRCGPRSAECERGPRDRASRAPGRRAAPARARYPDVLWGLQRTTAARLGSGTFARLASRGCGVGSSWHWPAPRQGGGDSVTAAILMATLAMSSAVSTTPMFAVVVG